MTTAAVERRTFGLERIEVRAKSDDAPSRLVGYAAVFNSLSEPIWGAFRERLLPGAFARALREKQDVRALIDHESRLVLGRSTSGTLRMEEDTQGLRVEMDLPDTSYARDLAESIRRGDVSQMSFGFRTVKGGEAWYPEASDGDGLDVREISDLDLFDVSVVTYPAYTDTSVGEARAEFRAAVESHEAFRAEQLPPAKEPVEDPIGWRVRNAQARAELGA